MIKLFEIPKPDFNTKEIEHIRKSGEYILGRSTREFEFRFAHFVNAKYAIAVNSCSNALLLSLNTIERQCYIQIPAVSFVATKRAVEFAGKGVLCSDIDIQTYNINGKIEDDYNFWAVIIVNLFGVPANITPYKVFQYNKDVLIIEDSAQHLGPLRGDVGCYSFFPTKSLTVFGDGGMVVTNKKEIYDKIVRYRNRVGKFGWNYRMSEIHAALGVSQLFDIEDKMKRRVELAQIYKENLDKPYNPGGTQPTYLYTILSEKRGKIKRDLTKEGIESKIYYSEPLCNMPNAIKFCDECLSLPLHPYLSDKDVIKICKVVNNA